MRKPIHSSMKRDYSIPKAAALCGVDRSTMRRWVNAGLVKNVRNTLSGRKRIPHDSIKRFIVLNTSTS